MLRGELGEPPMQRCDPCRADDERRHQRETRRNHFDAAVLAEVLHELFLEGGNLLLLTETDHHVSEAQIVA
jgi:hypothetical protein